MPANGLESRTTYLLNEHYGISDFRGPGSLGFQRQQQVLNLSY